MSESIAERLARLRSAGSSRESNNSARDAGGSNASNSVTAAARLAALREKKKSLEVSTTDENAIRNNRFGSPQNMNAVSDDDEGESTDESEVDENGKSVLDGKSRIALSAYDGRDIEFKKGPIARSINNIVPLVGSVSIKTDPYVVQPDNDQARVRRRIKIMQQKAALLSGGTGIEDDEILSQEEGDHLSLLDEGFYVPEIPATDGNVDRVEQRLLRELDQDVAYRNSKSAVNWFSPGGAMVVLADPSKTSTTQPADVDPLLADMGMLERVSTYISPALLSSTLQYDGTECAAMDIAIQTIVFDNHPLFCQEDIVASKLRSLFSKYQEKMKGNLRDHQTAQLNAMLQYEKTIEREDANLFNVQIQIVDLFSRRLAEDLEIRQLASEIYHQWQTLKSIRIEQEFSSTNLHLVSIPLENSFSSKMYQSQVARIADIIENLNKDADMSKKLLFNKARETLDRYNTSRSKKGADEYLLRLNTESSYSKDDEVPFKEQNRRKSIRHQRLLVRLFVNDMLIATTSKQSVSWPSFSCNWSRVFRIKAIQRPKSIRFDICAVKELGTLKKIASVNIPVPASEFTNVLAHAVGANDSWRQFASGSTTKHRKGRKTLKDIYSDTLANDDIDTEASASDVLAGQVKSIVTWSGTGTRVSLPNYKSNFNDTDGQLLGSYEGDLAGGDKNGGGAGVTAEALDGDDAVPDFANEMDFQSLMNRLNDIDPNDPRHGSVLRLFKLMEWSSKRGSLFRSQSLLKEGLFMYADNSKYVESKRVTLMKLRISKPHLFHQPIPLLENEIKDNERFQGLLLPEEINMEEDGELFTGARSSSEVLKLQQMQKARVTDFLNRIRDLQKNNSNSQRKNDIPVSRVVKEGSLPVFSLNFDMLANLFEPRRKLKPMAKQRKAASLNVEKAAIFVQIVRGINVPVRRTENSDSMRSPIGSPTTAYLKEENDDAETNGPERVMSFVQVRFQGTSRRCSAQEGPTPTWNESVYIPFLPPRKDFSPSNLQSINEMVSFNLFDEVIVDAPSDDYRTEDATFQKREKRYLGCFSIPFSTIYMNGRVEGMFRLNTPPVNLGYAGKPQQSSEVLESSGVLKEIVNEIEDDRSNATYVYIMATLDPVLATSDEPHESSRVGAGENEKVVKYAKQWLKKIKNTNTRTKSANLQLFGNNLNGDAVFVTRYIRPQVPPLRNDGQEMTHPAALLRFVSLVPFLDDWQAFANGGNDVWCPSQDFLEISAGDWEEHAILFCNYMLWAFKDRPSLLVYLVLGRGVPEGDTVYVLVVDTTDATRLLFNACTGTSYRVTDKNCPLRDVSLVLNDKNVWANVQEQGEPCKIRWNFELSTDWHPFWTPRMPAVDMPSVQHERLTYTPAPTKFISYLEGEVTEQLQRSMRRWRAKNGTTRFNKIVGRKLRSVLESLEESKLAGSRNADSFHLNALKDTTVSNKVFGFPLNSAFTEVDAVLKSVKNTDIHNISGDNVSFALAVLVAPYTDKVFSIWVYVVSLQSIR